MMRIFCGLDNELRLHLLVACCWLFVSGAFHSDSVDICFDLQPETVYVEEGATLRLNCSLITSSSSPPSCNASTLDVTQVRFRQWDGRAAGAILDGDVSVVEQSHVVRFAKQKAAMNDDGKVVCELETERSVLLSEIATIVVQRRPLQPTIDGCVVFNYERLVCKWSPTFTVQQNHTHVRNKYYLSPQFSWSRPDRNGSLSWQQCPLAPDDDGCPCSVSGDNATFRDVTNDTILDMTAVHCFRVSITNDFLQLSAESSVTCLRPIDHVVFFRRPPTSVSHVTIGSTRVKVTWSRPRSRYGNYGNVSLVYRVYVNSSWSSNTTVYETGTESIELVTIPFTNYSLGLTAKPAQLGYWGRSGSVYRFTTPPTVPCRQPRVAADVAFNTDDNDTVTLYWKPVPLSARCGPGFHYRVLRRSVPPTTTGPAAAAAAADWQELDLIISSTSNSVSVPLSAADTRGTIQFVVVAWNSLGCCADQPTDIVDVTLNSLTAPQPYVVVETFASSVTVHWFATGDDVSATSFTLYWLCSPSTRYDITCSDSINWFELPSMDQPVTAYTFNVTPAADDVIVAQYQFGVAATVSAAKTEPGSFDGTGMNTGIPGIQTGIHWADCTYSHTGPASPPFNVRATPSGYTALNVTWFGVECERHGLAGRIVKYIVTYCTANSHNECDADVTERQVPAALKAGSLYVCVLDGLQDETKYRVTVDSFTAGALRSRDQLVVASTRKHWASTGVIAALATVSAVVLLSAIVSCSAAIKSVKRSRQLAISVPAPVVELSDLSQSDSTVNDYQSTWINMERHGSDKTDHSARSRDSGWFDCPRTPSSTVDDSSCPLLSPTSTTTGSSCVLSTTDSCFVPSSATGDVTNGDWRGGYVSHDDVTNPSSSATTSSSSSCYVDHDVFRPPATGETFVGSEDYSQFVFPRSPLVTSASSPPPPPPPPPPPAPATDEEVETFRPARPSSPVEENCHDVGQYQPLTALLQPTSHFSFSPTSTSQPPYDTSSADVTADDVSDVSSERRRNDNDVTATTDDLPKGAENACSDHFPHRLCETQLQPVERQLTSPVNDVTASAPPSECRRTTATVSPPVDDMIDKYVTLEDMCVGFPGDVA